MSPSIRQVAHVRNRQVCALVAAALLSLCRVAAAQGDAADFEGWHLEPALGQAHLVMVARVASISRVTVIQGAKTEVTLREYRFQPIRRLKGLFFQREQLSMTASDLGLPADEEALPPPLKEGEFRLLILVQQQNGSMGCVSFSANATTFGERVPLLSGPDDPLVSVAETLIRVADSRSRRERATVVIEQLNDANGISAVPLLSSLRQRADWAAADERVYTSVGRLALSPSSAVRLGAVNLLRDMLASGNRPGEAAQLAAADVLQRCLDSDEANTQVRVAAIEAVGHLLAIRPELPWAGQVLIKQLTGAATNSERQMAAWALSNSKGEASAAALINAIKGLPLDEPITREITYFSAAMRLDSSAAEQALILRLKQSVAARQSIDSEVLSLGRLKSKESLPLLLEAAGNVRLPAADRQRVAWALGELTDDRAVAVLAEWMRSSDYQLKEVSLSALETIDSDLAAREVRPLLKSEANLPIKLRLARLLARHRLADGYPLATEHLADQGQTAAAALVLAALNDPRTANDLSAIIAARPDRRWHGAALVGLVAIGDEGAVGQLRDILANDRNALAAEAAEAAGLSTSRELLVPLANLARSRNQPIAMASLVAIRRFLSGVRNAPRGLAAAPAAADSANAIYSRFNNLDGWNNSGELAPDNRAGDSDFPEQIADLPVVARTAIDEVTTALAADTYIDAAVRSEALAIARLLGGERYRELLTTLADQAELESTPLLAAVQADRRRLAVGGRVGR